MRYKSIEIYYDVSAIPGIDKDDFGAALNFRNAAMERVERALEEAGEGKWTGAEIGGNFETGEAEVNFGFQVQDFDRAEMIVRWAVADTPYDCIREITRHEDDEDFTR